MIQGLSHRVSQLLQAALLVGDEGIDIPELVLARAQESAASADHLIFRENGRGISHAAAITAAGHLAHALTTIMGWLEKVVESSMRGSHADAAQLAQAIIGMDPEATLPVPAILGILRDLDGVIVAAARALGMGATD